jgi:hypothetical protein
MAENTNTERAKFEKWALENRLGEYTEQMGFRFFDAGDGYPSWKAWQARASVSLPAAGQEPVAYRYKDARGHWRYVGAPLTKGWDFPQNLHHEPLYAAPQPAVAAGWMPIETAPKHESVLLYSGGFTPIYCGRKRYGLMGEPQQDELAWRCDSSGRFANPSRWAPLPPAPSTEGESNG